MELEKIRAADTQIRWQDDEDVDECPSCKSLFTVTRRKVIIIHILLEIPSKKEVSYFISIIAVIVEVYIVRNV